MQTRWEYCHIYASANGKTEVMYFAKGYDLLPQPLVRATNKWLDWSKAFGRALGELGACGWELVSTQDTRDVRAAWLKRELGGAAENPPFPLEP